MKEILLETPTVVEELKKRASDKTHKQITRWRRAFYGSSVAGIISAATGLLLGAVSYIEPPAVGADVNQIGNFLIIAAFPLMMLAAHALDKLGELKIKRREPFSK